MLDKKSPSSSRVSAATKIIELSLKTKEQLEMEERIKVLESVMAFSEVKAA